MMWGLLLVLVVIVALVISQVMGKQAINNRDSRTPDADPAPSVPGVTTPETASRSAARDDSVLQPFSPIPLTLVDVAPEAIALLRNILDDERTYGRDRQERILEWLLTTNGRVKEIDSFITEWGVKFTATVKELCESDPDWGSVRELDRDDIRNGVCQKVIEGFEVRVADLNYDVIAEAPTLPATADDRVLAQFGFGTLSFYFQRADSFDRVYVAPSDDWYRPRFETLVTKGLAKRGTDLTPQAVLETMTLKEMEAVAEGVEHKRFTRRAPAIEFLTTLPDLHERLGRHVSLRERFQLMPLPEEFSHLDLLALSHAWAYTAEYAKLLDATYSAASRAQQVVTQATFDEYAKGWLVEPWVADAPCCRFCAKQAGEHRSGRNAPKLPHHVGCSCQLSQIYG